MDNSNNIMTLSDSYKVTHWKQYPEDTETVYSYFESRGGEFDSTRFFGLQYLLLKYLTGRVVKYDKLIFAQHLIDQHLGKGFFNYDGWNYIAEKHAGFLPIRIKAVPEGTLVPTGNILMSIENTDPEVPWLTNWVETLLVQTWYPTTVATNSYYIKDNIREYLEETGDPDGLLFKLHDFGFRGSTSVESSAIGGAAHLTNFLGTDTMSALVMLNDYYNHSGLIKAFGHLIP